VVEQHGARLNAHLRLLPRLRMSGINFHFLARLHAVRRDNLNFHFTGITVCRLHTDTHTYVAYSRVTSTKSSSFCIMTFSASLTNLTVLLLQAHDWSCYVSRPILAPPPLRHTDLRAYDEFVQSTDLWHQPRLDNVTCAWGWRLCVITHAVPLLNFYVSPI